MNKSKKSLNFLKYVILISLLFSLIFLLFYFRESFTRNIGFNSKNPILIKAKYKDFKTLPKSP